MLGSYQCIPQCTAARHGHHVPDASVSSTDTCIMAALVDLAKMLVAKDDMLLHPEEHSGGRDSHVRPWVRKAGLETPAGDEDV